MSEGAVASIPALGSSLPGSGLEASAVNDAGLQKVAAAFDQAVDHVSNRSQSLTQQLGVADVASVDGVDRAKQAMSSSDANLSVGGVAKADAAVQSQTNINNPVTQLQSVMNFATEMHLFVRTTTQLSSSMNTLTKGQ